MEQQPHEMASAPASKKRRRALPLASPLAGGTACVAHARGRRRESSTGDEDDGEIDEMLVALGIPDSDKKKKKKKQQQQREAHAAEVIELITPPRASSRVAAAVRVGARSAAAALDEDGVSESARRASGDGGERRRESIVDLTSPDGAATAVESVSVVISSSTYTAEAAVVTVEETAQRVRRTILMATSEDEATHELLLPVSPVLLEERTRPTARLPLTPQTPSSDRECDAMLEDLMLTRPLAERIAAARGRDGSSIRRTMCTAAGTNEDENRPAEVVNGFEERALTIAQGGSFMYSSITTTSLATEDRQDQGPRRPTSSLTSLSETLDFRMSGSHSRENATYSRPVARGAYEGPVGPVNVRVEATTAGTPQKKARASKAAGSKREPVVAVMKMERTLNDSEAGQVLKKSLQTHVYNNKPLVFELGAAFDYMYSNVIQWERREISAVDRSNGTKSSRNAVLSSAPSVCRFLSMAIYFQAEEFIQLLEQGSYNEVRSIMQFLKKDLQTQATRLQQRQSRCHADGDESGGIQLSTFLIIEGMDKCLINRKKKKQTTSAISTNQPAVQVPEFSFSGIHEMAFQLFMDTETHSKFTVDLDGTASYVAMLTREIVIAAARKTTQEDFLESVPRLHSFRVTSTGATMNNFANSWLRMLQMIPGVSEDKAQSILDHFPTFSSLMLAYSDPSVSQVAKEDLLASKLSGKNVGRAISKRIFNVFCVDDSEAFI